MTEQQNPGGISARFPDLAGKTAIVTGASRGIGCGIASLLGAQGMKLTLTARSEERGLAFAQELTDCGIECQWVTADCADPDQARRVFDAAVERFGQVDLLVNNAANLVRGRRGKVIEHRHGLVAVLVPHTQLRVFRGTTDHPV